MGNEVGLSTASAPLIFEAIHQTFACNLATSITYAIGGENINQQSYRDLMGVRPGSSRLSLRE